MKTYPKMKDSGVEWVDKIPEKWNVKRLKFTTKFDLSTVDRHEYNDEIRVSICHYPQVYNNEKILLETELPQGTCSQKELEKFRLKKDDVLITKDSETQDDIGVPVYIQDNFKNAVCGYHIAQLSTDKNQILGSFLFRFIQSDIVNAYFETKANGITRFGLGKDSINNLRIVLPSILEQKQISEYLEKKIKKIELEIKNNQKLIESLRNKKQATIDQAVTKGLDLSVTMKDSGVEWVDKIPEKWKINKIKFSAYAKGRIGWQGLRSDELIDEGAYLITGTDFEDGGIDWKRCYHVTQERYEQDTHIQIRNHDLLITKDGTIGKLAYVENLPDVATLNSHLLVIRPLKNKFTNRFMYWILQSKQFEYYTNLTQRGTTFNALSQEMIENFAYTCPPIEEQKNISNFIDKITNQTDDMIYMISCQIKKLNEYLQSLISSTVTGKIDVREVVA